MAQTTRNRPVESSFPASSDTVWPISRPESDRFVWQLDALLRRLGDVHLRISLARLSLHEFRSEGMLLSQAIADNLLDPCAMAGVMPDGSVVAAFLGPRSNVGGAGDDEITRRIHHRFRRAIGAVANQNNLNPSGLAIVHGWTDELRDLPTMTHELAAASRAKVVPMRPA